MKVYIGPYKRKIRCGLHTTFERLRYGKKDYKEDKLDLLVEKLSDAVQKLYDLTINVFISEERKVKIKLHNYDTWSADNTLSMIIAPVLKQLKETTHGSPFVDDEDVPEALKSTSAPKKVNEYDVDDNHFKRWDYVLDEMIWAFEQSARDDWQSDYYKYKHVTPNKDSKNFSEQLGLELMWVDDEGRKEHQQRMSNGFRLFGKYYEALWD